MNHEHFTSTCNRHCEITCLCNNFEPVEITHNQSFAKLIDPDKFASQKTPQGNIGGAAREGGFTRALFSARFQDAGEDEFASATLAFNEVCRQSGVGGSHAGALRPDHIAHARAMLADHIARARAMRPD
jgi:hypothetical protein